MAVREALQKFRKRQKMNLNKENSDLTESHSGSWSLSRILDFKRDESAKRGEQIQHIERLSATQQAQTDAVPKRLGCAFPYDIQPQASRRSIEFSPQGRRIKPTSQRDKRGLNSNQTLQEENPFLRKKLCLDSEMEIPSFKLAKNTIDTSPSTDSSLSSVDTHTPIELRNNDLTESHSGFWSQSRIQHRERLSPTQQAILQILGCSFPYDIDTSPSTDSSLSSVDTHTPIELRSNSQLFPSPPTAAIRRLPVMIVKPGQAEKNLANGCKLQTAQHQVEKCMEILDKFQQHHRQPHRQLHHPSPQAAPRRTKAVTAKDRLPPIPPNRSQPHCAVNPTVPASPVPPNKIGPRRRPQPSSERADTGQEDLQPLVNPAKSLSLCLIQLSSNDWEKNLEGLKTVRALVRHHPALLQSKLHNICMMLIEVMNNLRSSLAGYALDTVGELHARLGRAMDAEADWTGRALLLKLSQTSNFFIHQRANLALDELVKGCCPRRVMCILFNIGLNHACTAVRESTAQHLQQLVHVVGEDQMLRIGKTFTERFLTAICKMAVDAAPEVRRYGQTMIRAIQQQRQLIPEKYLHQVLKIFQRAR